MQKIQTSDTIRLGLVLAIAGGFMDAYSYICRGEVFANAQTGNMLLLGINIYEQKWEMIPTYLLPVVFFASGIFLADIIKWISEHRQSTGKELLHWRQKAILLEAILIASVGFFPQSQNLVANSVTSLACGLQVECFRKIHGNGIATTMCIGNLRSGTEHMYKFIRHKDKTFLKKSLLYFLVIFSFVFGAIFGNNCIRYMQEKAMFVCAFILLVSFFMMFIQEVRHKRKF